MVERLKSRQHANKKLQRRKVKIMATRKQKTATAGELLAFSLDSVFPVIAKGTTEKADNFAGLFNPVKRALATGEEAAIMAAPIILHKSGNVQTTRPFYGEGTYEEHLSAALRHASILAREAKAANERAKLDTPEGAIPALREECIMVLKSVNEVRKQTELAINAGMEISAALVAGALNSLVPGGLFGTTIDLERYGKDSALANMGEVRRIIKTKPKPVSSDRPKKSVADRVDARIRAIYTLRSELREEVCALRFVDGVNMQAFWSSPRIVNKLARLNALERRAFMAETAWGDF